MPWTPDPAEPIIDTSETAPAAVSITFEPEDPADDPPTGYLAAWDDGPIPPQVVLAGGVDAATLTAPNLVGLFPVTVDYLLGGVLGQVSSFDDLPPAAEDLVKFTAPTVNTVERRFTVTALFDTDPPEEQQFIVRVEANYNTGRDRLVLEVAERA